MALHEVIAWIGLLFGSGALITAGKILVDIGDRNRRLKFVEEENKRQASLMTFYDNRILTVERELAAYKLEVFQTFAQTRSVTDVEHKVLDAIQGVRDDFRDLSQRFDRFIEHRGPSK